MDGKFSFNDEIVTTGNDNEIQQEKFGAFQHVRFLFEIVIE